MQLQIASAALKFCVVVGLWSIYVADWQLALANTVAVAMGYRWLRQIQAKRGRTTAGISSNRSAAKTVRSPPAELHRKPTIEHIEDVQRTYPQSFVTPTVEGEGCDRDRSEPNGNTLSGSTVAVAAAFLTAFAESRESKADAKAKPVGFVEDPNRPSKQSVSHDADSVPSSHIHARRAVEASQQPKPRKSMLVRHSTGDVSNDIVDPEAEQAARRAEMELLELLDAEAIAQQPRKKTTPVATAPGGARGEDPTDSGRGSTGSSDSQDVNGASAPRKGQKQAKRPAELKTEIRRPNKKQSPQLVDTKEPAAATDCQKQVQSADAKADVRHQSKASDRLAELIPSGAAATAATATLRRPSDKSTPTSALSKKELRRRRAGQKAGSNEDDDEEEEDKSQQKKDGLAAVLSAVAKSNALNASRTMTRAQSEALSSTTMGSSGSTSSLNSPESLIANSEASSDRGLVETSAVEPRGRSSSGLGDCGSIEERPKASKQTQQLAEALSITDAIEGAESMDGEDADWVSRIHAVDDCFDFSEFQCTRSHEPSSLAQVQLRDEVTRCQALAPTMIQSDLQAAGQAACARELFPVSSQPAPKKAEGSGLAAELQAIFPSASIHIGPPAEGGEVSGTVSSPTPPTACPTPPLATTQELRHTTHYWSTTSSIISTGVPQIGSVASVGPQHELHGTSPTVHFSSHVNPLSSSGPCSEQNTSGQGTATQGTAHPTFFGAVGQTGPSGSHGGVVGSTGVSGTTHQWVGSSSPSDPATGNHGGRSSLLSSGPSMDGVASSKNPPLAAEVLFNLPTSASLGPAPTGALSVSQVEASTKASAWRAQLRRSGVQHLTEVEHALRRRTPTEQTTLIGMCDSNSANSAHGCPDRNCQNDRSSWQADHLSEDVPQNQLVHWMQNPMAGERPNHEQVPGDMLHQEMMSQCWSMQQQHHVDLAFAVPTNMDLMGTCSDAATEQIGASEVWRDQSHLSAASAPPKLWENQAASLAPQQYAESQVQYQVAYDQMYKSMLVARLEAAVPESYED